MLQLGCRTIQLPDSHEHLALSIERVAICLLDYDNVRPSAGDVHVRKRHPELRSDVAPTLTTIFDRVKLITRNYLPQVEEVEARLYGGWIDQEGFYMPLAQWILSELPNYRGRFGGLRLLPRLSTSLADYPSVRLAGTCRTDTKPRRQKMVDCKIAVDALYFATRHRGQLILLSSDEDLVPAAMVARKAKEARSFLWIRESSLKVRPNDRVLSQLGVTLGT